MFLGVDGKQVGMKMTEYQMAANSIGVTRRLERNVDRRLQARTEARAAAVGPIFYVMTSSSDGHSLSTFLLAILLLIALHGHVHGGKGNAVGLVYVRMSVFLARLVTSLDLQTDSPSGSPRRGQRMLRPFCRRADTSVYCCVLVLYQ